MIPRGNRFAKRNGFLWMWGKPQHHPGDNPAPNLASKVNCSVGSSLQLVQDVVPQPCSGKNNIILYVLCRCCAAADSQTA